MRELIEILKWDSDLFGINVGKTLFKNGIRNCYDGLYDECLLKKISLLYLFQDTTNKEDLIFLNSKNFLKVDEKIELEYVLSDNNKDDNIKDVTEFNLEDDKKACRRSLNTVPIYNS